MAYKFQKGSFDSDGAITGSTSITAVDFYGDGSGLSGIVGNPMGANLSLGDNDITNVGDINCDSISVDAAATGLEIQFGGNTTTNKIELTDNLADALNILEDTNSYMKFITANSSEQIVFGQNSTFNGTTIADLGTVTTATSITATDLIGTNVDGIIGADTARAGTFAAIVGTSLSVGDGNITNVGSIAADSVIVDDAAAGLEVTFGGNTTLNKITLTDNLADALNINQGGNSYMKFITTDSSEQIVFGKNSTFNGTTIADLGTVTTATSITATDLIGTNVDGIIGADTARAGTFAAIVGSSLSVGDGDITNVGDIALDSISTDGTTFSLDLSSVTTGNGDIDLANSVVNALQIVQGSDQFLMFDTAAAVSAGRRLYTGVDFVSGRSLILSQSQIYKGIASIATTETLTGISASHFILSGANEPSFTVTLPALSTGLSGWFKRSVNHTASIVIEGNGSERIDGSLNITLETPGAAVFLISDGSTWHVF